MASGAEVLGLTLNNLGRVIRQNANRMLSDLGQGGAARSQALRMLGAHAAAGAVIGGGYNYYHGESVMSGAMVGGVAGAAFGFAGGVPTAARGFNRIGAYRRLGRTTGYAKSKGRTLRGGAADILLNRAYGRTNAFSRGKIGSFFSGDWGSL